MFEVFKIVLIDQESENHPLHAVNNENILLLLGIALRRGPSLKMQSVCFSYYHYYYLFILLLFIYFLICNFF